MKVTFRKINDHACLNETWLAPYTGYIATIFQYPCGKICMELDGSFYDNLQGQRVSEYNGWTYTLLKLMGRPIY